MALEFNDKMEEYLIGQLEKQEQFESETAFLFADNEAGIIKNLPLIRAAFFKGMKYTRFIRHAIKESYNCEHCIESGLVDSPGKEGEGKD